MKVVNLSPQRCSCSRSFRDSVHVQFHS